MIDTLLSYIAPHLCCGCRIEGTLLCDNCKYDIISESYVRCIACGIEMSGGQGVCSACRTAYSRAWCVGDRRESLHLLIEQYKFYRTRQACQPLAGLLDTVLPDLPRETVIVPIPTLRSHVRERGYDHMALVGKKLAQTRGLTTSSILERVTNTKQLGAGRKQRFEQAKRAFVCRELSQVERPYLIIDDVVTTGATLEFAAKTLKSAGAKTVWVATISRQPMQF